MPDMRKKYLEEVRKALAEKLNIANVMDIPKLEKIVISRLSENQADRRSASPCAIYLAIGVNTS